MIYTSCLKVLISISVHPSSACMRAHPGNLLPQIQDGKIIPFSSFSHRSDVPHTLSTPTHEECYSITMLLPFFLFSLNQIHCFLSKRGYLFLRSTEIHNLPETSFSAFTSLPHETPSWGAVIEKIPISNMAAAGLQTPCI